VLDIYAAQPDVSQPHTLVTKAILLDGPRNGTMIFQNLEWPFRSWERSP
jgi:hypothetical protein